MVLGRREGFFLVAPGNLHSHDLKSGNCVKALISVLMAACIKFLDRPSPTVYKAFSTFLLYILYLGV